MTPSNVIPFVRVGDAVSAALVEIETLRNGDHHDGNTAESATRIRSHERGEAVGDQPHGRRGGEAREPLLFQESGARGHRWPEGRRDVSRWAASPDHSASLTLREGGIRAALILYVAVTVALLAVGCVHLFQIWSR